MKHKPPLRPAFIPQCELQDLIFLLSDADMKVKYNIKHPLKLELIDLLNFNPYETR